MMDIDDIMKQADSANILQGRISTKPKLKERINLALSREEKITSRDIIIFTQNFYLLKKANFNNIHALSTIIESTENMSLRGVLEDILAGVESGEYMYTTMEYYSNVFPYIYTNMIKVGELSGNLTQSLEQAVKYMESSTDTSAKLRKIIVPNAILLSMNFYDFIIFSSASQIYYFSSSISKRFSSSTSFFPDLSSP